MERDPLEHYQTFLDEMGLALLERDSEKFLRHIFLPHRIETEDTNILIEDMQTARDHFFGFADALAARNVDAYTRIAREAAYDGTNRLNGRHDTYITSGGKMVAPVFSNETQLERRDRIWGSLGTRHHARFVSWPALLPREGSR